MREPPKKLAQQTEDQLGKVAEHIRGKFDQLTERRFTDNIKDGRFLDQVDHGVDRARADERRRKQGGSVD